MIFLSLYFNGLYCTYDSKYKRQLQQIIQVKTWVRLCDLSDFVANLYVCGLVMIINIQVWCNYSTTVANIHVNVSYKASQISKFF